MHALVAVANESTGGEGALEVGGEVGALADVGFGEEGGGDEVVGGGAVAGHGDVPDGS